MLRTIERLFYSRLIVSHSQVDRWIGESRGLCSEHLARQGRVGKGEASVMDNPQVLFFKFHSAGLFIVGRMAGNSCITGTAGRWEARIGVPGNKHVYLGQFNDEAEAARAYDAALVRLRGNAAFTNFALGEYSSDLAAHQHMRQVLPIDAANAFKCLTLRNPGPQAGVALCLCVSQAACKSW
jgi:hypothetical protein